LAWLGLVGGLAFFVWKPFNPSITLADPTTLKPHMVVHKTFRFISMPTRPRQGGPLFKSGHPNAV
jgi:hypothetical protein